VIFNTVLEVDKVETRLLELPFYKKFTSSKASKQTRKIVIVKIYSGRHSGYGECQALEEPIYSDETPESCFEIISSKISKILLNSQTSCKEFIQTQVAGPMTIAGVEMALLDLSLKTNSQSLSEALSVDKQQVPAGAVVGIGSDVVEQCIALSSQGYKRLKIKIEPGFDIKPISNIQDAIDGTQIDVDGNGSYDNSTVSNLLELAKIGVTCFEQPFDASDFNSAKSFLKLLKPNQFVVADEAATSLEAVKNLINQHAANAISIKPARFGGIQRTIEVIDYCVENSVALTAGGMLETGLGRSVISTIAALDGFALTGDITPASHWFRSQPWPDLKILDGSIKIPKVEGLCGEPDETLLEQFTIRKKITP